MRAPPNSRLPEGHLQPKILVPVEVQQHIEALLGKGRGLSILNGPSSLPHSLRSWVETVSFALRGTPPVKVKRYIDFLEHAVSSDRETGRLETKLSDCLITRQIRQNVLADHPEYKDPATFAACLVQMLRRAYGYYEVFLVESIGTDDPPILRHQVVSFEVQSIKGNIAKGFADGLHPAILTFEDIHLEAGQTVSPATVVAGIRTGHRLTAKVVEQPTTPMLRLSLNVQREDAKKYLVDNKVLTSFGLEDGTTFKVILAEDFPFDTLDLKELERKSKIKFPRQTSYPNFKNIDTYEARRLLEAGDQTVSHLIIPYDAERLVLLWRMHGSLLAEELLIEAEGHCDRKLILRDEMYDSIFQIGTEFVQKSREMVTQLMHERAKYTDTVDIAQIEKALKAELFTDKKTNTFKIRVFRERKPFGELIWVHQDRPASREYFLIGRDRFRFHGQDFFHIKELCAWAERFVNTMEYAAYLEEHPEWRPEEIVAKPTLSQLAECDEIPDGIELSAEDMWFLGKRPMRGGGRFSGERNNNGDRKYSNSRGGFQSNSRGQRGDDESGKSWGSKPSNHHSDRGRFGRSDSETSNFKSTPQTNTITWGSLDNGKQDADTDADRNPQPSWGRGASNQETESEDGWTKGPSKITQESRAEVSFKETAWSSAPAPISGSSWGAKPSQQDEEAEGGWTKISPTRNVKEAESKPSWQDDQGSSSPLQKIAQTTYSPEPQPVAAPPTSWSQNTSIPIEEETPLDVWTSQLDKLMEESTSAPAKRSYKRRDTWNDDSKSTSTGGTWAKNDSQRNQESQPRAGQQSGDSTSSTWGASDRKQFGASDNSAESSSKGTWGAQKSSNANPVNEAPTWNKWASNLSVIDEETTHWEKSSPKPLQDQRPARSETFTSRKDESSFSTSTSTAAFQPQTEAKNPAAQEKTTIQAETPSGEGIQKRTYNRRRD